MHRFGKPERPNYACDIQIFVGDKPVAIYQRSGNLVVEVAPLVGDVDVKPSKPMNRFSPVRPPALLPSNRPLKTAELLLRFPIQLRCFHRFTVTGSQERLQAKVDTDRGLSRIGRRFSSRLTDFAHMGDVAHVADEDDIPSIGTAAKGRGLDLSLDGTMQLELELADVLEVGFPFFRQFGSVANRELHAVEPTIPTETRVADRLACRIGLLTGLHSSEEGLKSSVESFEGSLARGEVTEHQEGPNGKPPRKEARKFR